MTDDRAREERDAGLLEYEPPTLTPLGPFPGRTRLDGGASILDRGEG